MLGKILTESGDGVFLGFALQQIIAQHEKSWRLHRVKYRCLEGAIGVEELLAQIVLCPLGHLLIGLAVATCGTRHIGHHLGIDGPIGG